MKNFLVTGANGDIGEAVGRILIEEFPDVKISGADCVGKFPGSFVFSEIINIPRASDYKYQNMITDWMLNYDLIIPTSEPEIKKLATLLEGKTEHPFLIIPNKIVSMFLDKYKTFVFLNSHNFNPPITKLLVDASEEDLPIYLKPRVGAGGKGNRILLNKYDLLSSRDLPQEDWVVQELLTGEDNEYTCAIFKHETIIETLQLKRELYGDRTGKAEVVNNLSVSKLLNELAKSLDFTGSLNVQLKMTEQGPKIFEINPRISSTVMMRNKIGFKDCLWWVQAHLKLHLDIQHEIQVGTQIFRMSNEMVFNPFKLNSNSK